MVMKSLMAAALLVVSTLAAGFSLERYQEGRDYMTIPGVESRPNSVQEFFSYGCPHCYDFEPVLERWLKTKPEKVSFERVPAAWNKSFKQLAHVFYTLEAMSLNDKLARTVFDAVHADRKALSSYKKAAAFFEKQGVDMDAFEEAWDSEAVEERVDQSNQLFARYQIKGVPALVVQGKYLTSLSMAGSEAALADVIRFLLAK